MALKHLRSSTANKRPLPSGLADGQLAFNTEQSSPGLFFKNASGSLVKVGPVHVGATAPNATPASGGEAGNTIGEQWLDTSGTNPVFKIWDGSNWRSEAGEFVNASGDTMTGALVMDNQQQVRFRETTANGTNFIAIQAPASVSSDKTLTLPDATGTIVSTGDTGTVTSAMIANGTIVNDDISASAAIADTKLATISTAGKVSNSATTATSSNTAGAIVARDGSGNFSAGTITANLAGNASTVTTNANLTGDVTSVGNATSIAAGVIVDADINASAAIAYSKLAALSSANIIVGSSTNVPTARAVTGDVTISNTGVTAIAAGAIVNADISASADIAVSKLADGAARQLLQTNAAGTGVEWTSNVDIPGTLDVTGAATFDSTVTIGGSSALVASSIGSTVQGYDADLAAIAALSTTGLINRTGAGTAATVTVPSGDLVGTSATQTLTAKTLTDPAIIGTILEDVYTITDGAAFEIDPGNGSVQLITLGANRTPKATNFAAGEAVTLMVDDGSAYTLTWTDSTWGSGGVTWVGGSAPTLATSGYTVIQFWKVGTKVYGAYVGDVA